MKIRQPAFVVLAALAVLFGCGQADEPKKAAPSATHAYRIGMLGVGSAPPPAERSTGDFEQVMRDLGYVDGTNLTIEYRYANDAVDRLPELASELVKLKVDVIVTVGDAAALAAKGATIAIPIVATEIGMDPVQAKLVTNLSRPEANLTGLATQDEELWQKRLDVFRQIVPMASRLAVLWNPLNPGNDACVAEIKAAAASLGMQVMAYEVRDPRALEQSLDAIGKDRRDSLAICWDSVTLEQARRIGQAALQQRLAILAPIEEYVEKGSLMSIGISLPAHRRKAAYYVDKLLKGAKTGSLPVELPLGHEFVINVATARAVGIDPPPNVLMLADKLIK